MSKRWLAPLDRGRIRLRLLASTDLPLTLAWRNQDHIRKWFVYSGLITPEQHHAWYAKYAERDDDFVFIIEETQVLGRPVGQVSLYAIDWHRRRAEFGRLLIGDSEAQGRGLAREATQLVLDYGEQLGLEEFTLEVIKGNDAAISIYCASGFVVTGERDNLICMRRLKA